MHVRPATAEDLPHLVRIYDRVVEESVASFDLEPDDLERRRRWFEEFGDRDRILAAEVDGRPRAFAWYRPFRARPAYAATREVTVYVDEEHRGRGLGTALYERLLEDAEAHGVHTLVAVIALPGEGSIALHERFGFREVGRLHEVGRKFERWVDVAFFELLVGRRPSPTHD